MINLLTWGNLSVALSGFVIGTCAEGTGGGSDGRRRRFSWRWRQWRRNTDEKNDGIGASGACRNGSGKGLTPMGSTVGSLTNPAPARNAPSTGVRALEVHPRVVPPLIQRFRRTRLTAIRVIQVQEATVALGKAQLHV